MLGLRTRSSLMGTARFTHPIANAIVAHAAAEGVRLQYEGPRLDDPPLIALHRPDEETVRLLRAPDAVQRRMQRYCGSVAADPSGRWFAVSHPRGNQVTFWTFDGAFAGRLEVSDGCGLARGNAPGELLLTGGDGGRWRHRISDGVSAPLPAPSPPGARWDNHLTPVDLSLGS